VNPPIFNSAVSGFFKVGFMSQGTCVDTILLELLKVLFASTAKFNLNERPGGFWQRCVDSKVHLITIDSFGRCRL
jgi:hypothetical protein